MEATVQELGKVGPVHCADGDKSDSRICESMESSHVEEPVEENVSVPSLNEDPIKTVAASEVIDVDLGEQDPINTQRATAESPEVGQSSSEHTKADQSTPAAQNENCALQPRENTDQQSTGDQLTPYSYTARTEFTSENFKIEVRNMPRYYGIAEFKKFLSKQLGLNVHKMKPLPGRGAGVFITLHDEPSRRTALEKINGHKWKKTVLSARPAAAVPDPLLQHQKKRQQEEQQQGEAKKQRLQLDKPPLYQRIKDAVVPWWSFPYNVQLERKWGYCGGVMSDYKRQLRKINYLLFRWLENRPMAVDSIRPSPVTEHYRNKCEFTVGHHPETNERVVGFRLASYVKGSAAVAPLDEMPQVSERMRHAAHLFQQHVRESQHAPYNAVTHEGHWKQLLVRTTRGEDLLMSAAFHPQDLNEEQLRAAQEALRLFMTDGPGSAAGVTSLHWQSAGPRQSGVQQSHVLLHGVGYVTETMCGLQFRISPDAFFQVNTPATEVLYEAIGELADLDADTSLLDVCCGTGSIGLALAARAGAVVGVELVESAVADARANADRNGVANCSFYAGRAETMVKTVLEKSEGAGTSKWVAVVDPPRAGLGREVIQALRRAEGLQRVVFVACDLKQAMRNLLEFARPESRAYAGYPFVVRRVVPVDLFPQTPHLETAVLLERIEPAFWRQAGSPADDAVTPAEVKEQAGETTGSSGAEGEGGKTGENDSGSHSIETVAKDSVENGANVSAVRESDGGVDGEENDANIASEETRVMGIDT